MKRYNLKNIVVSSLLLVLLSSAYLHAESSSNRVKKFSAGVSLVDGHIGVNTRYYFKPKHSAQAVIGSVPGGTFFTAAYLFDFAEAGEKPLFRFYGGAGFISTTVSVPGSFLFGPGRVSASGLWLPAGVSLNLEQPIEIFAELDFIFYSGKYSGSDSAFSIGARYYF